jgi:acetolactate synthase-1/2/3 large subunit
VQADGSALYTLQALWTQARERLDVTTVLINNSAYAILRVELARTGAGEAAHSGRAGRMLTLADPTPDFVSLATGYGVPARRVETTEDLLDALRWAQREPGPHLIEAIVPAVG